MPNVWKQTLLFNFSSNTEQYNLETPQRSGGWSESLWTSAQFVVADFAKWASARALAMGEDCSIVGFRTTPYVYIGNKLIPGHALAGVLNYQGQYPDYTNSPDDTVRILCAATAIPITFPMLLRAAPDDKIQSARLIHSGGGIDPYSTLVNLFANKPGGFTSPVVWLGRDPTQIAQRVLSVNGTTHTIVTQGTLNAVANADFVRLRRVYDDLGNPIKGVFLCTLVVANADGSFTYTLSGLPNQSRTTPSGTARRDLISTSPVTFAQVKELQSRKIGRSFFSFRGRRTKQR